MASGQDSVLLSGLPHLDVELDDSEENLEDQVKTILSRCLLPNGTAIAQQSMVRTPPQLNVTTECYRYLALVSLVSTHRLTRSTDQSHRWRHH